jgi:hypothetical protein
MANNGVKFQLSVDGTQAVLSQFDRVRSGMSGISDAATTMGSVVKGMAAALSVGVMSAWIKGAIDAADATSKLSQKTGVAIKDVAGLQLAFRQAGAAEAFATSMAKMSKSVADGSKAFTAMGISTKANDGTLKSTRVLLGEVSDKFAGYADGIGKSALAQEIFGKSGAQLIPLLNAGAEGLSAYDEMALKLGLTLSDETAKGAEKFNDTLDLMGQSTQGMARQVAAQLLPTLNSLAGSFFDSMTSGDKLKNTANFLASAMKLLYISGVGVVEVFSTVGKTLGGVSAAVVAALSGDFSGATRILKEMKTDIGAGWQDTLKQISSAWNNTGSASVEAMAATAKAIKTAAPVIAEHTKAVQGADKAAAALLKEQIELAKWNTKAVDELFDAQEKQRLGVEDQIRTARTTLEQIEFETALLTMNTEQRALATMERELERQGIVKGTLAYDAYIVKLREAMAIKTGKEAGIKAADDMREAQQKAAEASEKYWTDALMRAFESGKGFFQSLWDTIKNTLKTQVLKVMVSATGLTGMSAAGAGDLGGSGGNLLGVAGNLGSMYNSLVGGASALGNLGATSIANGVGAVGGDALGTLAALKGGGSAGMATLGTAANYLGAAGMGIFVGGLISGGKSAIGGNSNTAVVAGTAIGALVGGPIGGFVGGAIGGIVNAAFGRGPTQLTSSGTRGTFSGEEFEGVNYANYKKKGGWFRSDKNWTDVTAMAAEARDAWSTAFAGVKGSVTGMAASLGLATDKITAYTKYVDIAAGTTEEQMTAIFTGMADDMALLAAPAVAAFAKSGETASTTLQRLSGSLTTANAWLSMLRNRLFDISLSGADAASKLADAFGSLDNLAASSKAYYDTFYSEAERTAISTENLAKAMALVNVALPTTKDAFREVVSGLDLTTESGRSAYAVMLALAPEFASTAAAAEKMATDTAAALLKAFSGGGQLVPVLNVAALAVGDVAGGAGIMTTALTYINAIMGDASSGVITLGGNIVTLGTGMTASQTSAALLSAEIVLLQGNTDSARIDFIGLGDALASVNTATFVATITGVFDNLAKRIGGVIDSITNERIAVREAALQIISPTVMSKASIQRGIDGIGTSLPSNSAVVAANTMLANADTTAATKAAFLAQASAQTVSTAALDSARSSLDAAKAATAVQQQGIDTYLTIEGGRFAWWVQQAQAGNDLRGSVPNPSAEYYAQSYVFNKSAAQMAEAPYQTSYNSQLAIYSAAVADNAAKVAAAQAVLTDAQTGQTTAATAAKKAALDYAASLQTFAIDAGKSVTKLTRLREETVKYYDAQKQLADLMSTSAAGLRKTVGDYRYGQLSADDQLAQLQGQFSSAYSLALAAQGDGATLAGYGDRLNGLLGPLIDKLGETNKTNLIANYLAQAESVASLIEQTIPVNYQQDSLDLLDSIDATLAALDASSRSAEQIIADAVNAGSDRTAVGLKTIGEAISGKTIPAFAGGGYHAGGMRLVGENGPELEVTGPSRIFNASQARGMLGGNGRLEALVERQAKQLEAMSFELRAIAQTNARLAKLAERAEQEGTLVRTDADTPLQVETV